MSLQTVSPGDVVAFLDLGTNSCRLLLVRLEDNHTFTVLSQQKEAVRLGEGEFGAQRLQPSAIARTVLVCRHFAEMARAQGAHEIIAVATSATREAENQDELLSRLRDEAKLDIRVISGREEARLIHLGVASGEHLGERTGVFIDIGGGSTEVIIGDQWQYFDLESLKLGAIRLAGQFITDVDGPVSAERYAAMVRHVRNEAVRSIQRLRTHHIAYAYGSSGTIENLAAVAEKAVKARRHGSYTLLSRETLSGVISLLRALPLDERRKVAGLNSERADIILPGAAILEGLMLELGLPTIRISHRGLRDGLLQDFLARTHYSPAMREMSVRARSVLHLGHQCGFDAAHAAHVARLAQELFDSACDAGMHAFGSWERELLGWAAQLHDIGTFLSYSDHHRHSYYIIQHADLLGFDQTELAVMATTAFFHRRTIPRRKHPEFAALDDRAQRVVLALCVLLRIAESLDRSHAGLVAHARFRPLDGKHVALDICAKQECQLEQWGVTAHADAVLKAFNRRMLVEMQCWDGVA